MGFALPRRPDAPTKAAVVHGRRFWFQGPAAAGDLQECGHHAQTSGEQESQGHLLAERVEPQIHGEYTANV